MQQLPRVGKQSARSRSTCAPHMCDGRGARTWGRPPTDGAPEGIPRFGGRRGGHGTRDRTQCVIGSGGKWLERAADGGERVAVCAVRDSEHNALEAATPFQCVEHIAPQVSHNLRAVAKHTAAPGPQYDCRAAGGMRRSQCVATERGG